MIRVDIPLRTARGQNSREHYYDTYRRQQREKEAVRWFLNGKAKPLTPCVVLLTRIAPSKGLDDDNLVGSMKAIRDAFAEWVGVDDKHRHIVAYEYAQLHGHDWGVRIEWRHA